MTRYSHTQPGTTMRAFFVPAIGLCGAIALWARTAHAGAAAWWIPFAVASVLLIVLGLFHSLTIEVTDEWVIVAFGPGLVRTRIAVADIADAHEVCNKWWYGWGIRLTPHGWLWNVSGLDAVELELTNGRCLRLGTDEPARLTAAIEQARAQSS